MSAPFTEAGREAAMAALLEEQKHNARLRAELLAAARELCPRTCEPLAGHSTLCQHRFRLAEGR